MKAIKRSIFTR